MMDIYEFDWQNERGWYRESGVLGRIWGALRNLHDRVTILERRVQRLALNEDVIAQKLGLRVEKEDPHG